MFKTEIIARKIHIPFDGTYIVVWLTYSLFGRCVAIKRKAKIRISEDYSDFRSRLRAPIPPIPPPSRIIKT